MPLEEAGSGGRKGSTSSTSSSSTTTTSTTAASSKVHQEAHYAATHSEPTISLCYLSRPFQIFSVRVEWKERSPRAATANAAVGRNKHRKWFYLSIYLLVKKMFREVVHLQQNLLVPLDRRRGEARQNLSITTCYRFTVRLRQNLSITRPNLLQLFTARLLRGESCWGKWPTWCFPLRHCLSLGQLKARREQQQQRSQAVVNPGAVAAHSLIILLPSRRGKATDKSGALAGAACPRGERVQWSRKGGGGAGGWEGPWGERVHWSWKRDWGTGGWGW